MPDPGTEEAATAATDDVVLVVDFGTSTSSAAVVRGDDVRLIREPATGSWIWPSAFCLDDGELLVGTLAENVRRLDPAAYRDEVKRDLGAAAPFLLGDKTYRPEDLVAEMLQALRGEAERQCGATIVRAVLTVPASYGPRDPRREAMLRAGELAGFAEVELLAEPVAAALAPVSGTAFGPGAVVLVYDLGGGTFDTAVVRVLDDGRHEVLGHAALDDVGGRDIDALLAARVLDHGGSRLAEMLRPAADDPEAELDARHVRMDLDEFVHRAKHHLSDATTARNYFRPSRQRLEVSRDELVRAVAPALERTVRCCTDLLDGLGLTLDGLTAIVLVGASCRMPAVADTVDAAFGRPSQRAEDLGLAVVTGAARWVVTRPVFALAPSGPTPDRRPLCWDVPSGSAVVERWLVEPGDRVGARAPIAVVRVADGSLLRLTNDDEPGYVVSVRAHPGDALVSGDWVMTLGSAQVARPAPRRTGDVVELQHDGPVGAVEFGSQLMALTTTTGSIWDPRTWHRLSEAPVADGRVLSTASAPPASLVVRGDGVSPWPPSERHGRLRFTEPVARAALSRDGSRVAVTWASGSSSVHVFDLRTQQLVSVLERETGRRPSAFAFESSGRRLAVAEPTGQVEIWDVAVPRLDVTLIPPDRSPGLALSSPLAMAALAVGGVPGFVGVTAARRAMAGRRHGWNVVSLAYSTESGRVVAGDDSGGLLVWDLTRSPAPAEFVSAHAGPVVATCFAPDPGLLATVSNASVALWSTRGEPGGWEPAHLVDHPDVVHDVAFSPDGRHLATACEDGVVRIHPIPDVPT